MVKEMYRRRSVGPCGMYGELKALIPLSLLSGDDPDLAPLIPTPGGYLSNFLQNALKPNNTGSGFDSEGRPLRPLSRLREPRDGLLVPPDCPQQGPRWPSECQVLDERVVHISVPPPAAEPFYIRTGREIQPRPVGEDVGQIVFQYYPISAVNYFSRSSVGGSRILLPACPPDLRAEDLRFESRFESGNLAKVVRITETYYELYLRTDMYTNRHMQWFYFRVANTRRHIHYRFSIVNLSKGESLYSVGMRPLLYSVKDAQRNLGWRRCGDNIAYYRNDNGSVDEDQNVSFTLSFSIEFPHDNDTVYLAHCYPYTYSDLQDYLMRLQNHPVKSTFSKLRLLCRSLAGNNVYYLTITTPPSQTQGTSAQVPESNSGNSIPQNLGVAGAPCLAEEPKKKRAVVLTARVHPGETPSSWMMKGFMDFLTGDSNQAKELRDKFIFKLVPMLNPDGVIVGNNRCSLTGRDLNRQYRTVIRETYPPVWHTKLMIRRLMDECGVAMYCDLHAHSRKQNVFIYGCENKRNAEKRLQEQVFPLMLHKNAADKFSFETCKFRIQRSKEGTGRVVVWMMGVANSYTMEASFAGSTLGSRSCTHFSAQDYENMGRAFCETLLDFCDEDPSKEKLRNKIINRLVKGGSNADEPTNIVLSDYSSDEGEISSSTEEEVIRPNTVSSASYHMCSTATVLHSTTTRSRRNEKTVKPKCQCPLERSPPVPRKILQVATATIDMPTNDIGRNRDADVGTTSPERESGNESSPGRHQVRNKTRTVSPGGKIGDKIDMPPELIVTPAHQRKGSKANKKSLEVPGSNVDRISPYAMSPSQKSSKSWHATRHRRKRYAKSHRQKGLLRPQTGIPTEDSCVTCEVCLECSVRLSNICSSDEKVQEKEHIFKCSCRNLSVVCQDPTGSTTSQIYECERSSGTSARIVDGKRNKRNTIGETKRTHRRGASMIPSHTSTSLEDTETTESTRIQWRRGKPRLRRQFGEEFMDQQESMTKLRVELQSNKHSKKQADGGLPGNLPVSSNTENRRKARMRKSLYTKEIVSDSTTFRSSTESRSRETGLLCSQLDDCEFNPRPTTRKKKRKSHVTNQLLV